MRYLDDLLQQLRNRLLVDVDLTGGRFSRIDECFNSLERSLGDKIGKLTAQKLAEAQAESDRLGEEAKLDDQQRQVRAEETRRQLAGWDGIGSRIQQAWSELEELEARAQGASKQSEGRAQEK